MEDSVYLLHKQCRGSFEKVLPFFRSTLKKDCSGSSGEYQVADGVAELHAALFKFGQRTVSRTCSVVDGSIDESFLVAQHIQNMGGIVFPVGSDMQIAAGFQPIAQKRDKIRLDQARL